MTRRTGLALAMVTLVTALGLTGAVASAAPANAPAGPAAKPTLKIPVARRAGNNVYLRASGLRPHHKYRMSSDVFVLHQSDSVIVKSTGSGSLYVTAHGRRKIALVKKHGYVALHDAGTGALVARTTTPVAPPSLPHATTLFCPGEMDSMPVASFPAGPMVLKSNAITFHPHVVKQYSQSFALYGGFVNFRVHADYAKKYLGWSIVSRRHPNQVFHQRVKLQHPRVYSRAKYGQARQYLTGYCFNGNQKVRVTPASAGVLGTPTAGQSGTVHLTAHPTALAHRRVIHMRLTSEPSGRYANYDLKVAGTTLTTGMKLGSKLGKIKHVHQLRSPRYDYRATTTPTGCRLNTQHVRVGPDGNAELRTIWRVGAGPKKAPSGTCLVRIRPTGNLVLVNSKQGVLWQSDTAGTGPDNSLVLRESGRLQLVTAAGKVVWHSPADPHQS